MKRFSLLGLMIALAVALSGCGGGGGGGDTAATSTPATPTEIPTPTGTIVNLSAFKNVFYGKIAGSQYSFNLSGTDSKGVLWFGSYAVAAKGATVLTRGTETQSVVQSQVLVSLQQTGGTPSSTIANYYFNSSDDTVFLYQQGGTQYVTATSSQPLPNTAKVGDFGTLASLKENNSLVSLTTINTIWQLNPDVNGASQLVITSDIKSMTGGGPDTEIDTFTLDANGDPTKVSIRVINRGRSSTVELDLTLSGKKN